MNVFDAVSGVFFDLFSAHSPSHNKDTMNPRLKIDVIVEVGWTAPPCRASASWLTTSLPRSRSVPLQLAGVPKITTQQHSSNGYTCIGNYYN